MISQQEFAEVDWDGCKRMKSIAVAVIVLLRYPQFAFQVYANKGTSSCPFEKLQCSFGCSAIRTCRQYQAVFSDASHWLHNWRSLLISACFVGLGTSCHGRARRMSLSVS